MSSGTYSNIESADLDTLVSMLKFLVDRTKYSIEELKVRLFDDVIQCMNEIQPNEEFDNQRVNDFLTNILAENPTYETQILKFLALQKSASQNKKITIDDAYNIVACITTLTSRPHDDSEVQLLNRCLLEYKQRSLDSVPNVKLVNHDMLVQMLTLLVGRTRYVQTSIEVLQEEMFEEISHYSDEITEPFDKQKFSDVLTDILAENLTCEALIMKSNALISAGSTLQTSVFKEKKLPTDFVYDMMAYQLVLASRPPDDSEVHMLGRYMAEYRRRGFDPAYFMCGAGAPGNCILL